LPPTSPRFPYTTLFRSGAKESLAGGRSEADKQPGFNQAQLRFEPGPAGGDFARVGFLMDSPLPARLPFEMLDRICDVNLVPIDRSEEHTSELQSRFDLV